MSTETNVSLWSKLKSIPKELSSYGHCNLLVLNSNELVIVTGANSSYDKLASLWKYDINKNEWNRWYFYPKGTDCRHQTSIFNHNKTKLFTFGDPGYVNIIDLKTGQFTSSPQRYHDGSHAQSLFIKNKLHIFGGWLQRHKSHFIYDHESKHMEEIRKFDEIVIDQ